MGTVPRSILPITDGAFLLQACVVSFKTKMEVTIVIWTHQARTLAVSTLYSSI